MRRRLAIGFGLLIAIPVVGVPLWIATHRTDLPSPGDADLALERSDIPAGENGFEHWREAAALLHWPEEREWDERLRAIRSGELWDPDWTEETIARNAPAMAELRRGLAAPAFQLPPHRHMPEKDGVLEVLFDVQRLVKLAGADARLRLAAGDPRGAVERALLGMRAGRKLSGAEGAELIEMMLATACQGIGLADLEGAVREAPLTREQARSLAAHLESERWSPADWDRAWAAEYQQGKAILRGFDVSEGTYDGILGWIPPDYLWQPNRTFSALAERYRDLQGRGALDCRESHSSWPTRDEQRLELARDLLSPNPTGAVLVAIAMPKFAHFDLKRCHLETRISLVQTLIAAKAYWLDEGALPARLGDLVPDYLDALPADRFVGAPLRYSRERQLVYSVGEDFADAGGGDPPDTGNAAEPGLSLAF